MSPLPGIEPTVLGTQNMVADHLASLSLSKGRKKCWNCYLGLNRPSLARNAKMPTTWPACHFVNNCQKGTHVKNSTGYVKVCKTICKKSYDMRRSNLFTAAIDILNSSSERSTEEERTNSAICGPICKILAPRQV